MRILHVIRTLNPGWGGQVEGVRNLSQAGQRRGHYVEVACLDAATEPWLSSWTNPVHALGRVRGTFGYSPMLDQWLAAHIREYDVVVVEGIWMYFSYSVWKASKRFGVPYYLFIHGALDPWFKRRYPLKHIKKILYWKLFERKVVRDAKAVLFTAEEEMLLAHNAFRPYECKPIVVGYGIVPPYPKSLIGNSAARRELALRSPELRNRRFILFLARIHEKKGIDLLLKAFARCRGALPNMALVITGGGDPKLTVSLKRLASWLGISDDVVWTGPLYENAKLHAINAADAYILPSHQENFGISVVEALAFGTPVLISDKVNIWREIDAAGAGLIEPDTVEGTARLLQRWLSLSEADKLRMRMAARECFTNNFDVSVTSARFFDVLQASSKGTTQAKSA